MPVIVQTVLGASNFDGTQDKGLVAFPPLPAGLAFRWRVNSIGLTGAGSMDGVRIRLRKPGGATTEYLDLVQQSGVTTLVDTNCGAGWSIPMESDADGTQWELVAETTTKGADASLIVDYDLTGSADAGLPGDGGS